MRVTQSMLSGNMLRNLSNSYTKMGELQNQITTGKKVNRPSDDPVVAMKGIALRSSLEKVEQFQRNLGEVHNLLDSSDDALDKVGSAMQRVNELMVQASSDTTTNDDREKIESEISQIRTHIQNISNTKVGNKYIFSGTKTTTPLHDGTNYTDPSDPALMKSVEIEVFDGVKLKVNTNVIDVFNEIDVKLKEISDLMVAGNSTGSDYSQFLKDISDQMDNILTTRADIGARQNRAELMENRLQSQSVIATKQMSENEDIDYEKSITEMITQESVHRAALSVGAKIIQPSLADFIR
ncbi:flagellar hook-associated protein FlgL [Paenisporosarcina quisquiliarum]|uniref:flagellar hook-associated protein FlgL n=1 Tax=Paenisporosarcina quisquiliarum TaxID=365346 RepID=UPI00373672F5